MADPSNKTVHLRDVAERAGVSVATVSMALSNHPNLNAETKQRIRDLSREMGYKRRTPRSSAADASKQSVTRFGFLLLGSRMDNEVHLGELQALSAAAAGDNVRMEVLTIPDVTDRQATIDQMLDYASNLDGLVVSGMIDITLLRELETAGVPHVVMGYVMDEPIAMRDMQTTIVTTDPVTMGLLATRHLIKAGHTRIAFVCERILQGLFNDRWLRGYRIALAENHIEIDPKLVGIPGKSFADIGPTAAELLALDQPPTAFVVPDARTAATLLDAVIRLGGEIDHQNMIVGGHLRLLGRFGLRDYPSIGESPDRIAEMAIRMLRTSCDQPLPGAAVITVPFETQHLDVG